MLHYRSLPYWPREIIRMIGDGVILIEGIDIIIMVIREQLRNEVRGHGKGKIRAETFYNFIDQN